MKIVLTTEDIEYLIKKSYNGVKNVDFGEHKDLEINLDVDFGKFSQIVKTGVVSQPTNLTSTSNENLSEEEKFEKEARKGVMASGGMNRTIQHIG